MLHQSCQCERDGSRETIDVLIVDLDHEEKTDFTKEKTNFTTEGPRSRRKNFKCKEFSELFLIREFASCCASGFLKGVLHQRYYIALFPPQVPPQGVIDPAFVIDVHTDLSEAKNDQSPMR